MTQTVTVLAPITLASGKTEADLLAASQTFQTEFVAHEKGVLRRELVRKPDGTYLDIVQFRSAADFTDVMKREMESPACQALFALIDMDAMKDEPEIGFNVSLATY